jgi:DNA-binding NarL/FixJ family response regulator/tetratricopeptide (TPR) repeat protein
LAGPATAAVQETGDLTVLPASVPVGLAPVAGRSSLQHGQEPAVSGMPPGSVMGRDAEVARLAGLARDAASGRGRLIVIEGETGIGKTAVLRAVLDSAAELFARQVSGAAEELDQRLPFAAVHSCLEPLKAGDRRVAEVLGLIRRGGAEYPVIESILALVEEWCAAGPVALAVDDAHWADPASVLLLHRLGRVARQLPLLAAVVLCSGAGRTDVAALTRSWRGHGAVTVPLGPLPEPAVGRMVADLAGGLPGPRLRGLVDSAAGNPLYISELVSELARDRRLRVVGEVVDVEPGPDRAGVPPTLGAAIAGRLGLLSDRTRELLQVAALLGTVFSVADVAAVLDHPVTDLLGGIREAADGGVLDWLPDRLAFRHPLVRAALEEALPVSARQALHLQVAQALTARASTERVAGHLLAAGPAAAPLMEWLAGRADELAARAPVLAAEVLGQVLGTVSPAGETAGRLRSAWAAALLRTGRPGQAERAARSALAKSAGSGLEACLRWTLASACASQGAFDRAAGEIGAALASGRLTRGEQARFHGLDAHYRVAFDHLADADAAWQESMAAAQASGDTEALAYAMAAAAGAQIWDGWPQEALACAGTSVSATEALGARAGAQLAPHLYRGICLAELDRDAEAALAFEDALRVAERGVGTDCLAWRYSCVAQLLFYQGRWDEALAEAQTGLDLPDVLSMGRHLRGVIALIAIHRRDRAALASQLPFLRAPLLPPSSRGRSAHVPDWALALAAHAEGNTAEAAEILGATWDADIGQDQLRFLRHYLVPDLIALTLAAGHPATARRIADSIDSYAAQRSAPGLRRSARHARALASQDAAMLVEVAEEYQNAGRELFAAQAREQAAPLLAAAGQTREARTALVEAAASYEYMEASWDLARAGKLLRGLSIRRGVGGPRRRPKFGWGALTDTEKTVAGLVAEGLSNPAIAARLYLSPRTVQGHVSSILGKLGVASRVQLAAIVIRHETAPDLSAATSASRSPEESLISDMRVVLLRSDRSERPRLAAAD